MDTYSEVKLGPEAVTFIKDRLANGKTLAKLLLRRGDLDGGKVSTFLPPGVDEAAARKFDSGGLLLPPTGETHRHYTTPDGTRSVMMPVSNTRPQLGVIIQEFLKQGEGHLCLFESAVASPTDGFLSSPKLQELRVLTSEDDVYFLLTRDDLDPEKIDRTIRHATSHLVIGVLAHLSKEDNFLPVAQKITDDDLKLLAERTQKIIVGAYDGEGYLIWSQTDAQLNNSCA
jgi:hypothetical protein